MSDAVLYICFAAVMIAGFVFVKPGDNAAAAAACEQSSHFMSGSALYECKKVPNGRR